ncbi:MAG TPA: hypothetical protein VE422_43735 [Terriglobia bacterium]|nr:hypothetical protein [Terriglobia bacterium]
MPVADPWTVPQKTNRLALAKDLTDLLSKTVPLIAGTIYLAGYFITAGRLAEYGVAVTRFVDAQYFIAGVAPAALLLLTLAVICSAMRYRGKSDRLRTFNRMALVFTVLAGVGVITAVVNAVLNRFWKLDFLAAESWFDLYVAMSFRAALGQVALWVLIAGLRSGLFTKLWKEFRTRDGVVEATQMVSVFLLILGVTAGLMVYGTYGAIARFYTKIPQSFGGGKVLRVQLYVEREKTPAALLANSDVEKPGLVYTVPVSLVFQTADSFIVDAGDGAGRVWILDARIVHAVVSSAKDLTIP